MRRRRLSPSLASVLASGLALVALAMLAERPAGAQAVSKSFDFAVDRWFDVEQTQGPLTIHRVRVRDQKKNIKSKLFRPGNSEYLSTIVIEIEFTNEATRDVEVQCRFAWKDAQGRIIDGYDDEEDMDDEERHEIQTITLSTLQYGLDVAETLVVELDW